MTPSSNLLKQALRLIKPTVVLYYRYHGRVLNDIRNYVPKYLSAIEVPGSWQPVKRKIDYTQGYNLQKNYFNFFCSKSVLDLQRYSSGDRIAYEGYLYQCESITDWFSVDGWVKVLCVRVGLDLDSRLIVGFNTDDFINDNQNFEEGNFAPGLQ